MVQPCNSGTQEHSAPDGYADFSLMIIMIRDNREHPRARSPVPPSGCGGRTDIGCRYRRGAAFPAVREMFAGLIPRAGAAIFLPVPRTVSIMQYGRAIANDAGASPKAKQGWP